MKIKPRTQINMWGQWPEDVEPLLKAWNHGNHHLGIYPHWLSFRRSLSYSAVAGWSATWLLVFKCEACEQFCETHPSGAAILDGYWLCDDCLIEFARNVIRAQESKAA